MSKIKSLYVTAAQVAALNANDLQILPAPPSGFAYEIYRVEMLWGTGSIAWTSAGYIMVGTTAGPRNWWVNGAYFSTIGTKMNMPPQHGEPQSCQTDVRLFASAVMATGNYDLYINVVYDTVPIT